MASPIAERTKTSPHSQKNGSRSVARSKKIPWPSEAICAVKDLKSPLNMFNGCAESGIVGLLHPSVPALPHDADVAKSQIDEPCSRSLTE